ncbi:hypothetical protein D3C81_1159440 [compost metagenome]
MTHLKLVLPARGLAELRHYIELATQKRSLLLNACVVETNTALHQGIQLIQILPDHPFSERCIEQFQRRD